MSRVVDAFLARLPPHLRQLDTTIHPRDSMFRWGLGHHHGYHEMALLEYFRSGLSAYRTAREILGWRFGEAGPGRLLDFGSGFGRLTRFLVRDLPPKRLWTAEIVPQAVEFQHRRFGVGELRSTSDPAAFAPSNRLAAGSFDAILAFSVLTHLPRERFGRWLRAWLELLAEGGVLVFSVHGETTLLPGRRMPGSGFYFEKISESEDLDLEEYGTAYVTEAYLSRALAEAGGGGPPAVPLSWRRFPRGLWHFQDLCVVVKGEAPELPGLELVGEPTGQVETCALDYGAEGEAEIALTGWALGHGSRLSAVEVELAIVGEPVARTLPTAPRPDALELLAPGSLTPPCGWALSHRVAASAFRPQDLLTLSARCQASGVESILHLGSVEATFLYLELHRLSLELQRLTDELGRGRADEDRVGTVERNGLGELRRRWRELRRRLGRPPHQAQ